MTPEDGIALAQVFPQAAPEVTYQGVITSALAERRASLDSALGTLIERAHILARVATLLVETLRSGRKVLMTGNGGSAAEAQHFAAELVGRFKRERAPYAALALTTDSSILTAVANDYGYHDVFARQILALGQPGDLLIAFSTSGQSENLLRAAQACRQRMMRIVAVTGERASRLERAADVTIHAPLEDTACIQELHLAIIHILCDIAETELSTSASDDARERVAH